MYAKEKDYHFVHNTTVEYVIKISYNQKGEGGKGNNRAIKLI
jgi:hypothetical protein